MNETLKRAMALVAIALLAVSCTKTEQCQALTLSNLRQMQSFTAKVDTVVVIPSISPTNSTVAIVLRTVDGKCHVIDHLNASSRLADFAKSLKEGNSYEFPKTLLSFEDSRGFVDK